MFPQCMLKANLTTDEIDAVVCATRRLANYLVGAPRDGAFKTVRFGTVLAQKARDIRTCFKPLSICTTLVAPTASISSVTKPDYMFGMAFI